MKPKTKVYKILSILSLILSVATGFYLLQLFDIPFGWLFDSILIVFAIFVILFFFSLSMLCFKSRKRFIKIIGILPVLVAFIVFFLVIIIKLDYRMIYFQSFSPHPTTDEWIEDLHYLSNQMEERHPDLYSLISKETFEDSIKSIENRIPDLTEDEIIMELFKLSSLPNDAHTFPFIMFPCYDLHTFPIQVFYFDDGLAIVDAGRNDKDLIGSKILKIGSKTPDEIFKSYPLLLSVESEMNKKQRFPYMALTSEWLTYHKIIDDPEVLQLTILDNDNNEQTVSLPAIEFFPSFLWTSVTEIDNESATVYSNPREDNYHFELREKSNTLYLQFNQSVPHENKESLDDMVLRLEEFVESNSFDRFIIDLRNNDGGQNIWNNLVTFIRDNETLNQKGKIYVLIGRRTFSSAVLFANQLQMQTNAIFVGEPASQGPHFFAGPFLVELPNSKLVFAVSTRQNITGLPFDKRKMIVPDISVSYTLDDFNSGKDPVYEAALSYQFREEAKDDIVLENPERYTGRYAYNPIQVMDITLNEGELFASFSDFIPNGLVRFNSDLYPDTTGIFHTKLTGLTLKFNRSKETDDEQLIIYYQNDTIILKKTENLDKTGFEYFSDNNYSKGCKIIIESKELYKKHIPGLEGMLNARGYELMRTDEQESALHVFKLNTELFPESSNVYDSYGEALRNSGNVDEAVKNYKKSLELNPKSESGKRALKEMGA